MFQSIEKVVPKLLAAVIITVLYLFSLIVLVAFELLSLQGLHGNQSDLSLQTAWLRVR